jgi:hypothetical protein
MPPSLDSSALIAGWTGKRISSTVELTLPSAKVVVSLSPTRKVPDERTTLPLSSRVSDHPRSN